MNPDTEDRRVGATIVSVGEDGSLDDGTGKMRWFESEEFRDRAMKALGLTDAKREEMSKELCLPVRRLPVPFDVGEKLVIKGGYYEVEKIEPKRLTLKVLPRDAASAG